MNIDKPHAIYGEDNIDPKAIEQFASAMSEGFAVRGALMPDAHYGYSLPIGGVVATRGVIVPAWVGYDIGCGMSAVRTPFTLVDMTDEAREAIFHAIYRSVPTGTGGQHSEPLEWRCAESAPHTKIGREAYEKKGRFQLGTLGSGNHFIEIGHDELDRLWIVIHSGSRGMGHMIASHYMKLASGSDKPLEGHFGFSVDSDEGKAYLADLGYALEFAIDNRMTMLYRVMTDMHRVIRGNHRVSVQLSSETYINRNHNHAVAREVDGEVLYVHRKGATHAEQGMMGVIPGNMQSGSFVVRGKGNPDSLFSSSHGAGRMLGRNQAMKQLDLERFKEQMRGITALVEEGTLDESPGAYKDIHAVIADQAELIEVVHHLKPVINIKAKGHIRRKKAKKQAEESCA